MLKHIETGQIGLNDMPRSILSLYTSQVKTHQHSKSSLTHLKVSHAVLGPRCRVTIVTHTRVEFGAAGKIYK